MTPALLSEIFGRRTSIPFRYNYSGKANLCHLDRRERSLVVRQPLKLQDFLLRPKWQPEKLYETLDSGLLTFIRASQIGRVNRRSAA